MMLVAGILGLGIAVGLMSSMLGLGGGIVIVPALTIYFGFSQHEAIATSLFTIIFVALVNSWRFQRQKLIDWKIVRQIMIYSSITSFLAGQSAVFIKENILIFIFIVFLLYMSISTFRLKPVVPKTTASNCLKWPAALKIGALSGAIAGVTGIGGGGITTPMLMAGGCVKGERAAPISNAIMIFTTLFSSFAYMLAPVAHTRLAQIGHVHVDTALVIFLSAFPAAFIGSNLQKYLPFSWRKNLLGIFLLIISLRLILKLLN
jgi:uncharacterized membrane protein YfcA